MEKKIYNAVESALKKLEFNYDIDEECVFTVGIKAEHATYHIRLFCEEEKEILMVVASCGMCVPKDKMDRMCRWIVDKNYAFTIGEFKLDTEDGDLTYRVTATVDEGAINEGIVGVALSTALNTFESEYEQVVRAIYFEGDGKGGD